LLNAFRAHYAQFLAVVTQVHTEPTDSFLLQLLGEDLNQFAHLAHEHAAIFESDEAQTLQNSLQAMILDIRALHEQSIESSHSGRPEVVFTEYTGHPGRPRTAINPDFLSFAYRHRSTSALSHFLDIPRSTLRRRLLEYGIASPGTNPFPTNGDSIPSSSSSGYITVISDDQLDSLLGRLRIHFHRAGIRMLDDGYSRLVTGLRANNNNRGQTVLSLFLSA
ncbi:hypothetical protein F5877DRAFT_12459, partial [Lentinula edodes]